MGKDSRMPRKSEVDFPTLCKVIYSARLALEQTRATRREHVRLYAGANWGNNSAPLRQPVNLISQYVQIILRNLIAKNPQVMLSTFDKSKKPMVKASQSWANHEIKAMRLDKTLGRVALDGLFCMGITKVALASPGDSAMAGWNLPAGQPYAKRVDFDDFVFDVHARDFDEVAFIGHRFRVPLEVIQDSKLYSKARKDLTAQTDNPYNREGDERINMLFRGYVTGTDEELEPMVDLWEIYCPRHDTVYTVPDLWVNAGGPNTSEEPLRAVKWIGPERGPYHLLSLLPPPPGNVLPKGPIMDLVDLHEAVNRAARKLINQADRQKDNTFVQGAADADGKRVIDANDGDIVRVDNPDKIHQVSQGGPNPGLFAFMTAMKDLYSWLAGNLDIMGGLAPQSKTASQDKMLDANSARSVSDMQATMVDYVSDVLGPQGLLWYWWHHPQKVMDTTYEVPGVSEVSIRRRVTPQDRASLRIDDLDLEVNPYSLAHTTPQQRSAGLKAILAQVVAPFAALMQQDGIKVDMNTVLSKIGEYEDQPDIAEILTITQPPVQEGGGGEDAPPMAAETTRNYVRESRSGMTDRGQAKDVVTKLMGATGAQPKQMDGFA
jgi:hypothetical protein